MKKRHLFLLGTILVIIASCAFKSQQSQWSQPESWYNSENAINDSLVDVFYVVSTNMIESHDSAGNEVFNCVLSDTERQSFAAEMAYMQNMFTDSLNFFSPYYHQVTMRGFFADEENRTRSYTAARNEIFDAFDYYMENLNGGRRFIIAGFSQGAMLTLDLLKHMTNEQYSRLVAAYMIGFRLTEDDIAHPHISPALDATTNGVTISFNSVASLNGIWPVVTQGAAYCTNPLTWRADTLPAQLVYQGDTAMVHINPKHHVLLVEGIDAEKYAVPGLEEFVKPGNLHHADILFYFNALQRNALLRAYGKER